MANYSHNKISNWAPDNGDTIEGHNFTQKYPHTGIGAGITGLRFKNCNLVNCDVPVDATVENCNTTQISRCGHLNDGYECAVDCEHLVSEEDVVVDGVVIDVLREYADEVI